MVSGIFGKIDPTFRLYPYICKKNFIKMPTRQWYWDNREKMREHRKKWYEKNKESERQKAKERIKIRRKDFNEWYAEFKSNLSCIKCGFSHPAALDFHHRDRGEKEYNIARLVGHASKKSILEEMEKCDVLCANCHRILHYNENNNISEN